MGTDPSDSALVDASWPPLGSELFSDPDLPGPAFVVSRVSNRQVVVAIGLPLLVFASFGRLAAAGLPVSRVFNPGVLGLFGAFELLIVAWSLVRRGSPTVVGTNDWVAARGMFGRRWHSQLFGAAARFSRSGTGNQRGYESVVIAAHDGARTRVPLRGDDPSLPALLTRLRSAGAAEVARRELPPVTRGQLWGAVALFLVTVVVPTGYLIVGPLTLLPPSIAGLFTWSGCRASLAVEGERPAATVPAVRVPLAAGGEAWSVWSVWHEDAVTFAHSTGDPAARAIHLRQDGFLIADGTSLYNPAGAVVQVVVLRFATPEGAQSYDTYVNRAVCEKWSGQPGPQPTEVYLHEGKSAVIRWVGGSSIIEVRQASSTPLATPHDVEEVAAALTHQTSGTIVTS